MQDQLVWQVVGPRKFHRGWGPPYLKTTTGVQPCFTECQFLQKIFMLCLKVLSLNVSSYIQICSDFDATITNYKGPCSYSKLTYNLCIVFMVKLLGLHFKNLSFKLKTVKGKCTHLRYSVQVQQSTVVLRKYARQRYHIVRCSYK